MLAFAATALLAGSMPERHAAGAPRTRAAPGPRGYRAAVARWHEAPAGRSAPVDENGRPVLALVALNTGERAELPAGGEGGDFDALALERAARLLRDPRTGAAHPVEPALLDLAYRAQRRFNAAEIRVISGYRAPGARGAGNHGRGRAMDLVVPGATDEAVAAWARTLGFVGVGLYPNGGYCHLDARGQSHFWVDRSGPGQRNREVGVMTREARGSDAAAIARRQRAVRPFALPSRSVEEAWRGALPAAESDHDILEDDGGD